jgi:drug/metabolite transporter (DMT)-like permease
MVSRSASNPGAVSSSLPDNLTLLAFSVAVLIGGSNAVAVRVSNLELPPFWGAAMRFLAASLIFWIILVSRRVRLPSGRALVGCVLYGALGTGASYAFLYWGLLRVEAPVAMIILALGPLLTMLFAAAHRLEAFRWRALFGSLTALIGIVLAVGSELGASLPPLSLLALLAGSACIAESSVIYKLFPKSDPSATNAIAETTGTLMLLVVSLLARETWALPAAGATLAAFTYLVILGSVVLFYLYLFILSRWTATATSYAFLLFPIATVIISAWVTDEVVTPRFLLGGLVVLAGVWIGALSQPRVPQAEPAPAD